MNDNIAGTNANNDNAGTNANGNVNGGNANGNNDFRVVINDEEQYSIWPADRALPAGWNDVGQRGDRTSCLDYIERVWVDMRPASVRKQMTEARS